MAVRAEAQQNEIEARKFSRFQGKKLLQSLLVAFGRGRGIRVFGRDGKYVGSRHWNLRQDAFVRHAIIALRIRGRHVAFVSEEKVNLGPGKTAAGIGGGEAVKTLRR